MRKALKQILGILSTAPVLLTLLLARSCGNAPSTAAVAERPNFLIIITDDQCYDTLGSFMPRTQARIFNEGVQFTKAYVTTPLCCPSRASILTGMYAHRSGVRVNSDSLRKTTFADRLHEAGYFTGLVGKYLNSWDGSARPEFDFWVAFAGGGSRYFNPRLNVNGSWSERQGYMTYILRDYALRFLNDAMMAALFVLPSDFAQPPEDIQINRLDNQVLTRYHESEWKRWE